jgi:hypothetical protein
MRRVVPFLLVLLIAGGSALLAGCAGKDAFAPPPPDTPLPQYSSLAQLGKATLDQRRKDRTARFHLTGVTLGGAAPQTVSGDGSMSLDGTGLAMQVTQHVQQLDAQPGPSTTLVIVLGAAYLKVPDSARSILPPGRSWFHIQDDSSSPAMHQFAVAVANLRENVDPTQGFSQLGSSVTIGSVDQELLDDVWSVRYRISLNLAAAAQLSTDPTQQAGLRQLVQSGASTDDTVLWLDGQNRLLRMVLTRSLLDPQGHRTTYTLTLRYHDWGQPVQITAPPPDQVVGN